MSASNCLKAELQECGGFHMLLGEKIITDSKELIKECLKCDKMNKECSSGNRETLLKLLDSNEK